MPTLCPTMSQSLRYITQILYKLKDLIISISLKTQQVTQVSPWLQKPSFNLQPFPSILTLLLVPVLLHLVTKTINLILDGAVAFNHS